MHVPFRTPAHPSTRLTVRRLAAGLAALSLGASTALVAGCGGDDTEPVRDTTTTEQTATTDTIGTTTTPAETSTVPSVTTTVPTTPATTATTPPTATSPPLDGGAEPTTPTQTTPTTTGTTPTQDPNCKPGTGRGFPDRPQCEPVEGPDAQDEG
ncbi:MAG: hypothetical protein JWP18_461 [Solirubrobacterales bacterium]|nr:hypothetical protein [Solirubrobacterales bacterium]